MDLSKGYMVLDVETTGLDPEEDRIVELAVGLALAPDPPGSPGQGLRVQSWLISDTAHRLTPETSSIHGILRWEAERLGMPMYAVLGTISRAWGDGLPIVAHNGLRFDRFFVLNAFAMNGMESHMATPTLWIDTAALYKGMRMGWAPEPGETHEQYAWRVLNERVFGLRYNLNEACRQLDIPTEHETMHRAGTDVYYTARLFEKMLSLGVKIDGLEKVEDTQ